MSEPCTDEQRVERIAAHACDAGVTVAVAESLTAGNVSALLGRGSDAATWWPPRRRR